MKDIPREISGTGSSSAKHEKMIENSFGYKYQEILPISRPEVTSEEDNKISRKGVYSNKLDGKLRLVGWLNEPSYFESYEARSSPVLIKAKELLTYFKRKYNNNLRSMIGGTKISLEQFKKAIQEFDKDNKLSEQHRRKFVTRANPKKMKDVFEEHFSNISNLNAKMEDAKKAMECEEEMDSTTVNKFIEYEKTIQEQFPEQEKTANNHIAEIRRFLHSYENSKEIIEDRLDEYTTCGGLYEICKNAETQITKVNNLLKDYALNYNSIVEGWTCLESSILTLQGAVEKLPGFWDKIDKSVNIAESPPIYL